MKRIGAKNRRFLQPNGRSTIAVHLVESASTSQQPKTDAVNKMQRLACCAGRR